MTNSAALADAPPTLPPPTLPDAARRRPPTLPSDAALSPEVALRRAGKPRHAEPGSRAAAPPKKLTDLSCSMSDLVVALRRKMS